MARASRSLPADAAVLLLIALAAPVFPYACDRGAARAPRGDAKKITIAVTPWPASAAIYIAHEKGYFRDEGLDPTLRAHPSGHLALADVIAHNADLAAATETPIARAALDGKPIAVIATICDIDRAILIIARKDSGIAAAADLRGRKVGRVAGSAAEFFLHIYLTSAFVDPTDVRAVDLSPERVVPALLDGDVDAVCTWAPQTTTLRDRLGGNAVILDEPGLYTMTWNVVASGDLATRDPDVIARFLRAIVRANRFIASSPAEARAITAKNTGMDIAALEKEWVDYRMTAVLDQSLVLFLEDQARWMMKRRGGGARRFPNVLEFIDPTALRTVQPDAVRLADR